MITSNFNTLLEFELSKYVDKEYIPFVEDLIRIIILQCVLHIMYFIKDPEENPLFSISFVEIILYLVIGVSVYWLIFKKLVTLT